MFIHNHLIDSAGVVVENDHLENEQLKYITAKMEINVKTFLGALLSAVLLEIVVYFAIIGYIKLRSEPTFTDISTTTFPQEYTLPEFT